MLQSIYEDFVKDHVDDIIRDTQCQIQLGIYNGDGYRRQREIYFDLAGTQEATTRAIHALERSLVGSLDRQEKGRALYYMALLNAHRRKNDRNKVVRQFCYHLGKEQAMRYMFARRLPQDEPVIAVLIGRGGHNHKKMMRDSGCHIQINARCSVPHYVIDGESESEVVECSRLIEESLKHAEDVLDAKVASS